MANSTAQQVLDAAVETMGGTAREGQRTMVAAIEHALDAGEHLLIQAGTGTGKSLGYLVPVLTWLAEHPKERAVIATATLALQSQLATKDIPSALAALEKVTGKRMKAAVLKGRSNYVCLHRVRDAIDDGEQAGLWGGAEMSAALSNAGADAESQTGAQVLALREWAEEQAAADLLAERDDAPSHGPAAWAQVSVPVRECLGAQRCPFGEECFVEKSRDIARRSDIVITNHALLAIDAMHGGTALPEHSAVIIDEAHELTGRVTGAASAEMSPQSCERVAKRAMSWVDDDISLECLEAADTLRDTLDAAQLRQVEKSDQAVLAAVGRVRDAFRALISALNEDKEPAERGQASSAAQEVFDVAERIGKLADVDVVWISERERAGRQMVVAPLSVAGLLRERVLAERVTILTSATLEVGGGFDAAADSIGLCAKENVETNPEVSEFAWRGVDVGTPFDYARQGILYLPTQLGAPTREGIGADALAEIAELMWAAGGKTLGLFASMRAANAAASHVRRELPALTVLCQGDAHLSELVTRFAQEESTSLFGTLSLWQGVDIPGDTCQLVIIDKIPFPRPDDPLMQARQRAVTEAGGNGFMTVAARHAALLLAQGSGRLIRRGTDRGVVAILDPRLTTARYGGFLRASIPPMWRTHDRERAVGALRRLAGN